LRIIVVGDGKVGLAVTAQLSREGHDLLVIDSNENVLKDSVAAYDVQVIQGNGASLPICAKPEPPPPIC
jgi:trk system potassium uptake protein TrkA